MPIHVSDFNLKIWVNICHCLYPEEVALMRCLPLWVFRRKLFPHLMQVLFNLALAVFNGNHDLYNIENEHFKPFLEQETQEYTPACSKMYTMLHYNLPPDLAAFTDPLLVVSACRESINAARFGVEPKEPTLALLSWLKNPAAFGKCLPLLDPREVEPTLFQAVRNYVEKRPWEKKITESKPPAEFILLGNAAIAWLTSAVKFATLELRSCLDESRYVLGLLHVARKSKCSLRLTQTQRRVLLYAKLCTSPLWELRGLEPPKLDECTNASSMTKTHSMPAIGACAEKKPTSSTKNLRLAYAPQHMKSKSKPHRRTVAIASSADADIACDSKSLSAPVDRGGKNASPKERMNAKLTSGGNDQEETHPIHESENAHAGVDDVYDVPDARTETEGAGVLFGEHREVLGNPAAREKCRLLERLYLGGKTDG